MPPWGSCTRAATRHTTATTSTYAKGFGTMPEPGPAASGQNVSPMTKKLNMRPTTAAHPWRMTCQMDTCGTHRSSRSRNPALTSSARTMSLARSGRPPLSTSTMSPRQNRKGEPACTMANHHNDASRNDSPVLSSAPWNVNER